MTVSLNQELVALLGPEAVLPPVETSGPAAVWGKYAVDRIVPRAVVRPADRESIAQLLRWATARQVSVLPRGGGVLTDLGNRPARVDVALDLSRYNRVLDYQPADLTATVEPGVTLQTLRQELARGGKFAPLEAPLADRATLGGILAASASGPLRYSYGLPRDWLIGISVVGADGVETKAGGRVVKNVTGYDLNKLYTGSLGTLGVIVEATFKLSPLATAGGALVASFPAMDAAIAAGRSLISQVYAPQGLHAVNRPAARRLNLNREGKLADDPAAGAFVLAFFAGHPRAVVRRREESARRLRESGAGGVEFLEATVPDTTPDLTRDAAMGAATADAPLLRRLTDLGWSATTIPGLGLKVNLPPTEVGKLVASVPIESGESGDAPGIVADLGFGVAHLLWWAETSPQTRLAGRDAPDSAAAGEEAVAHSLAEIERVREAARSLGGTVLVEHCPPAVKARIDVWGGAPANALSGMDGEIMRRIKRNFDPSGILNPGRFVGGL